MVLYKTESYAFHWLGFPIQRIGVLGPFKPNVDSATKVSELQLSENLFSYPCAQSEEIKST